MMFMPVNLASTSGQHPVIASFMETRKENWNYFRQKFPDAYEAYQKFGRSLGPEAGPLDAKTCALVKLGIAAASQYDLALRSHIEKAEKQGCTFEEMEHAIVQTATSAGFPRMMAALLILREEKALIGEATQG